MSMKFRGFLLIIILLILTGSFTASQWPDTNPVNPNAAPLKSPAAVPQPKSPPKEYIKLTLLGDIMCHPSQYEAAKTDEGYNFNPAFEDIGEYTSKADLTLANLETTLGGKEMIYSGYPSFNTPEQLAQAVKNTLGVDIVSTANNHALDRHYKGLCNTIDFLDEYGLKHTGTYKSEAESRKILIEEIKGLKIAFLSYTYGTNGIMTPENKPFAVNYIDRNKILNDSQKAREQGAHLIIASMHWGEEYSHNPSQQQVELAHWIFKNTEVDIISGNHVHAVQPIEFINLSDESGDKDGLVIYAQGNFFSDQKTDSANRGIIVDIELEFSPLDNHITFKKVYYTPVWVDETPDAGLKTYRVLNVERALKNYEQHMDDLLNSGDYEEMQEFVSLVESIIDGDFSR